MPFDEEPLGEELPMEMPQSDVASLLDELLDLVPSAEAEIESIREKAGAEELPEEPLEEEPLEEEEEELAGFLK